MKKKLRCFYLSFMLFLIGSTAYPQWQNGLWTEKQAYNWYFYFYTGLNFDTSPPTEITDSMFDDWFLENQSGFEGSGSISDSDGNVLFYTNGDAIWNSNNELMGNGYDLLGETSATQTGLTIPVPGSTDRFYVFSADGTPDPQTVLAYSEVDMTLNGGLGDVTENKNIVLSDAMGEKLSAVYHANGEDVWVVAHTGSLGLPGNTFKAFLVTGEGVSQPLDPSLGEVVGCSLGKMKIPPDVKKMGGLNGAAGVSVFLQVFDFDNETGILSNPVTLTSAIDTSPGEFMYGLEFSPNSRFLYFSEINFQGPGKVHQLDLEAGTEDDIIESDVVLSSVTTQGTPYYFMSMQVGPDGKIYLIKQEYGMTISVINNPNNKGADANFQDLDLQIFNGLGDGLPGFIQSYFASGILYEGGSCANEEVAFSTLRIPDIESIAWDFGDPASGADNASAALEPVHAFSGPGTYLVTAIITSNDAEQTATTEIIITAPDAVIPDAAATTLCADASGTATFNLENLTPEIVNGQDTATVSVSYFASEEDVAANAPIAGPSGFTTSGQAIYAKVTNSETGCSTLISFTLTVNPLPLADDPQDVSACNSYELPALSTGNSYWTGTGATGVALPAGTIITETTTLFIFAQSPANPECASENVLEIQVTPTPSFNLGGPYEGCRASDFTIAISDQNFDLDDATYTWTINGLASAENGPEITATEFGSYEVTVTIGSCSLTQSVEVIYNSVVNVGFEAGCNGNVYWLAAISVNDSFNADTASYSWSGPGFTSADRQFEVPVAGIYTVTVTTEDGCSGEGSFEVDGTTCEVPKGISPNGDGMNDTFDLSDYDVRKLSLFNRYGQEVYSKNNYVNEWAGQADNGDELPSGTYYYMMERRNSESKTGWVYINRED
jgi:gliding motility-associated-like protein